jgi:hypothetical protein
MASRAAGCSSTLSTGSYVTTSGRRRSIEHDLVGELIDADAVAA